MEAIFLKVLNMSLTASYVIAAILIVRLLLKRAPGKYSYALWAVAAFRLLCPVSFESFFSLFALKGLSLNIEKSSAGAAEIVHIPDDIGMMVQPEITTGIPAINHAVNPMLPAATPQVSANPMQIWIFIGMVLWCTGIALLVLLSLISLLRLKARLSTATRLEGNVWQSESVLSPFILGLFRPRIYIPYGLGETQLSYVLEHERTHIRRGDHIIKLLAFAVLCLHWFNPLVWLAYYLMGRDMEQSCDERVLSKNPDIGVDYSTTLLSFAVNRRLPLPTALAFGESGVKSRIKNALRWRKPKVWVSITALILCIAVVAACAANPKDEPSGHALKDVEPVALEGTYVPWDCVHQHPAVSYVSLAGNSGYKYVFENGSLSIIDQATGKRSGEFELAEAWQELPWSDEEWEAMLMLTTDSYVSLSQQYMSVLYCPLDGQDQFLMLVDGQLWIVSSYTESDGSRYIMGIYSLVPEDDMGCAQGHYNPVFSSQWGIPINFDIENLDHVNILCDTGMVAFAGEGYIDIRDFDHGDDNSMLAGDTLLWSPINTKDGSAAVYPIGVIQFTAVTDTQGISGTIYLDSCSMGDNSGSYIYTLRVVGTGLYIQQDSNGRISITHNGEGAWKLPTVSEVPAEGPWGWLSTVRAEDITYLSSKYGVDVGRLLWPDFTAQLVSTLNSVTADEVYTYDHGTPAQAILTLHEDGNNSISLLYCDGVVELGFGGDYFDAYGGKGKLWMVKNEALNSLLEWLILSCPEQSEEMLTDTDAKIHSAVLAVSGGYLELSPVQTQELERLLSQETTLVAKPENLQDMLGDVVYLLRVSFKNGKENYIYGCSEGDTFFRCTNAYGDGGSGGYVMIQSPELSRHLLEIISLNQQAKDQETQTLLEQLGSLEFGSNNTFMVEGLAVSPEFDPELSIHMMEEHLKALERENISPAAFRNAALVISLGFEEFEFKLYYDLESVQLVFQGHWGELHSMPGLVWDVDIPELKEYLDALVADFGLCED